MPQVLRGAAATSHTPAASEGPHTRGKSVVVANPGTRGGPPKEKTVGAQRPPGARPGQCAARSTMWQAKEAPPSRQTAKPGLLWRAQASGRAGDGHRTLYWTKAGAGGGRPPEPGTAVDHGAGRSALLPGIGSEVLQGSNPGKGQPHALQRSLGGGQSPEARKTEDSSIGASPHATSG